MDPNALLIPLTILLALAGAAWTFLAHRRSTHPRATLVRGAALTLLPIGLYLTGTLRLLWDLGALITSWARHLALGTAMNTGLALLGVAVVAFVVASVMKRRGAPVTRTPRARAKAVTKKTTTTSTTPAPELGPAGVPLPSSAPKSSLDLDDDVAEILDRRGIK